MTLDILICTLNGGIEQVPRVLLPQRPGVGYVVSMQYTDSSYLNDVPAVLRERKDVKLTYLAGKGLSRNRNNALLHSSADICLIADDDNKYQNMYLDRIFVYMTGNTDVDIALFKATTDGVHWLKPTYPRHSTSYEDAIRQGYYPSSVEMVIRRKQLLHEGVLFNERFGLGSDVFCSGEESIFIADALRHKMKVHYFPELIVQTPGCTTGSKFASSPDLQVSKGATFCYCYGRHRALWLSLKESLWYLIHKGKSPISIFRNMYKGITLC